jgi:hypothetical protein
VERLTSSNAFSKSSLSFEYKAALAGILYILLIQEGLLISVLKASITKEEIDQTEIPSDVYPRIVACDEVKALIGIEMEHSDKPHSFSVR